MATRLKSSNSLQRSFDIQSALQEQAFERYGKGLDTMASPLRLSLLQASPELARIGRFLEEKYNKPISSEMEANYADRLRNAQAARGFGGGGSGLAGEEARFLFGVSEQQRQELLPFQQQFGTTILGMTGFGQGPQAPTFGEIDAARLQRKQLRLQEKQFKFQRTMGIVNASIGALGAVAGGIGSIASAYNSFQQGNLAGQSMQFNAANQFQSNELAGNVFEMYRAQNQGGLQPLSDPYQSSFMPNLSSLGLQPMRDFNTSEYLNPNIPPRLGAMSTGGPGRRLY